MAVCTNRLLKNDTKSGRYCRLAERENAGHLAGVAHPHYIPQLNSLAACTKRATVFRTGGEGVVGLVVVKLDAVMSLSSRLDT